MTQGRTARLGRSLAAVGTGWVVVNLAFFAYVVVLNGYVTDAAVWLVYTGLFVVAGWLLTVVPLVLLRRPDNWLFLPRWAPVVGGTAGIVILGVLLGLWTWTLPWRLLTEVPLWFLMAGAMGAIGWTLYCLDPRRAR